MHDAFLVDVAECVKELFCAVSCQLLAKIFVEHVVEYFAHRQVLLHDVGYSEAYLICISSPSFPARLKSSNQVRVGTDLLKSRGLIVENDVVVRFSTFLIEYFYRQRGIAVSFVDPRCRALPNLRDEDVLIVQLDW